MLGRADLERLHELLLVPDVHVALYALEALVLLTEVRVCVSMSVSVYLCVPVSSLHLSITRDDRCYFASVECETFQFRACFCSCVRLKLCWNRRCPTYSTLGSRTSYSHTARQMPTLQVPAFAARFALIPNALDTLVNRTGFHLDNVPERATPGDDDPVLDISVKSGHLRHLGDQPYVCHISLNCGCTLVTFH
jgi:hypothetical protein